jgi:hypothetical protein
MAATDGEEISPEAWAEFCDAAGQILTDAISGEAPVAADRPGQDPGGTLAASFEWHNTNGRLEVGSRDPRGPIAAYVARGTAPHPIEPVNAPYLLFYVDALRETGEPGWVHALHVNHPGTAPNPFHIRGWEAVRDQVFNLFAQTCPGSALALLNPWRDRAITMSDDGSTSDSG